MQFTDDFPRIELGHCSFRMPSAPHYLFGTKQRAETYAKNHDLSADGIEFEDTRPTLGAIMRQIIDAENNACNISDPRSRKFNCGPWDEYITYGLGVDGKLSPETRWPDGYRWVAVYPVHGGSEGIYLHVDLIFQQDGKETRQNIFLAKTCSENREAWEACYASAMRIAWMLQA